MKRLAIIGCGFVANYYMLTLSRSKTLRVEGVLDTNTQRASDLATKYDVPKVYGSLDELLADPSTEIVLNLTNPAAHYLISRRCIESGKHVYSEKPLAMTVEDSNALADLADLHGLRIACAPCSMLSEVAQTVWKAVRENRIGKVHLAYAALDEDLLHKLHLENMLSGLGVPWPAQDEYEVGVTLEHAGYYLAWLVAFFGPAKKITSYAACLIPDKMPGVHLDPPDTPDFTNAVIEFASGTIARVTCSLVAQSDHSLQLFGETGILTVDHCWNYGSPVWIRPRLWNRDLLKSRTGRFATRAWRKLCRHLPVFRKIEKLQNPKGRPFPLVRPRPDFPWDKGLIMDFSRGVQELADSIDEKRPCRLSTRFSLHITELALAMNNARTTSQPYHMTSTFDPLLPMPWAI